LFKHAAQIIKNGGIIAYPTEAVWGLGCDPFNQQAVINLLNLKKRDISKGLILVAADFAQIKDVLDYLTSEQIALITKAQHTTFLFKHHQKIPPWITGGSDKFALRISKHPPIIKLCKACNSVLVSTSANISNMPCARDKQQLESYFGKQLDFILDAKLGNYPNPSTIIDFAANKIIRT